MIDIDEGTRKQIMLLEQFSRHRAVLYAITFAAGLLVLLVLRDNGISWYGFWLLVTIIFAIMAVEFVSTFHYAKRKASFIKLSYIPDNMLRPNAYYHIVLPTVLLLSFSVYLYMAFNRVVDLVLIGVFSIVYYGFLRHIRATYENDFKTEKWSQGVLDSSSIVVFFSVATAISELANRNAWGTPLVTLIVSSLLGVFALLILWKRQEMRLGPIFGALVITVLMTIITYLSWQFFGMSVNPLKAGFFFTLSYYLLTAAFLHKLEGTLRLGTITEYLLIAIVSALLLTQA